MKRTYITNYRLASALIANGYPLIGVANPRSFSSRQYFFHDTRELEIMTYGIEEREDTVSSYDLYQANDFLSHEIRKEQFRSELMDEFENEKEV